MKLEKIYTLQIRQKTFRQNLEQWKVACNINEKWKEKIMVYMNQEYEMLIKFEEIVQFIIFCVDGRFIVFYKNGFSYLYVR